MQTFGRSSKMRLFRMSMSVGLSMCAYHIFRSRIYLCRKRRFSQLENRRTVNSSIIDNSRTTRQINSFKLPADELHALFHIVRERFLIVWPLRRRKNYFRMLCSLIRNLIFILFSRSAISSSSVSTLAT